MYNYSGPLARKSTKQSVERQSKNFLVPKPDEIKKITKSNSITPNKRSPQAANDKKSNKMSNVEQPRQTPDGKTSNRQQKFYQTWMTGTNLNINSINPVLKTRQDESTMSTTINQSEALDPRSGERKVEAPGQRSPTKQDNSGETSMSFGARSVQKQTNKFSKLEEILKNPRGSINSDSKSVIIPHMRDDTDIILRKSSENRLITPLKSAKSAGNNKSYGSSVSFSLSGMKDVAMAETKVRDKSPEMQRLLNTFGVQKYVQDDEALSKIKWRNPYKKELDSIMKPKIIAATKIQKTFRAWIHLVRFRRYLRAIQRLQRKFRCGLFKKFEIKSRLEYYLQREGRTYNRIRTEEMKSLETDHKTNVVDEDIKFSINEYYCSIVSERENLQPFKNTNTDCQSQSAEEDVKNLNGNNVSDLEFFTRIIDLDVLTDSREVNSKLWIDQYYHVTENLSADAPIQTIEVGENVQSCGK